MRKFERNTDGGLNAWIETYEGMGEGENDAEMLCLLLELRRRRENQAEAEREREELRHSDYLMWHAMACKNGERARIAEAELARRDAAAGEPEFYVRYRSDGGYEGPLHKDATEECRKQSWSPLYAAAQPAVLPPDITFESKGFRSLTSEDMAYNLALMKARELGAQQQEVVELDNVFSVNVAGVAVRVVLLKDVSTSLDAAGVKWEVKK